MLNRFRRNNVAVNASNRRIETRLRSVSAPDFAISTRERSQVIACNQVRSWLLKIACRIISDSLQKFVVRFGILCEGVRGSRQGNVLGSRET